ncbi:hypothetical protein LINPERHAP1_LOCUS30236 [Linum perenne]
MVSGVRAVLDSMPAPRGLSCSWCHAV